MAAGTVPAANRGYAGLDEAGSTAAAEAAASRKSPGLGDGGLAAASEAAASRKSAVLGGAGFAAAAEAAASRKSVGLGGAGLVAAAEAAASRKSAVLCGAGLAAASAAAATRGDAGLDDAGSEVVKAVDRAKEGAQLEVVTPRPQLLVLEPLTCAECAPPTDTGRIALIGDNRRRRPACVGTNGRTAAVRAGAPFGRADAARDEPCCRNGRSLHSPTPSPPAANRPLRSTVLVGSKRKAAACAQSGRQRGDAARLPPQPRPRTVMCQRQAQRRDGRQERRARANGATSAAKEHGGREKARKHARPPFRDATRPPTKMAAATKHARTTSPLPRCSGGRWRRWRPQARTRMRTAPLSAQNGSRSRGQCPRRCDPAHS